LLVVFIKIFNQKSVDLKKEEAIKTETHYHQVIPEYDQKLMYFDIYCYRNFHKTSPLKFIILNYFYYS
jgi:hypothetical protein